MTTIIDGKKVSAKIKEQVKQEIEAFKSKYGQPGLAVVLVGSEPASCVYVNMKKKACVAVGINSYEYNLKEDITEEELINIVKQRVEEGQVAIRNVRHEALGKLKDLEKNKEISQDDEKRSQIQLQKLTDTLIGEAEQVGRNKETELVQV